MSQLKTDVDVHADRDWIHDRLQRLYAILAEIMMGICATRTSTD